MAEKGLFIGNLYKPYTTSSLGSQCGFVVADACTNSASFRPAGSCKVAGFD